VQLCWVSSHHIVRDNQEAALILANGESCSLSLVEELMEWSPFVLALDGALIRAIDWKIKVDVWLGDFDSTDLTALDLSYPIETEHTPNQDFTDLQKGFEYLYQKGFHSVHVLWATGFRMDHYFNNIFTAAAWNHKLNITFIDDFGRAFFPPKKFKKWYPKNSPISLLPVGNVSGVKTENLVWNLNFEDLSLPNKTSSSNKVAEDGFFKLEFDEGHLLIFEAWSI